jgi:hypothetical protein
LSSAYYYFKLLEEVNWLKRGYFLENIDVRKAVQEKCQMKFFFRDCNDVYKPNSLWSSCL